jgi:hypothetical protein
MPEPRHTDHDGQLDASAASLEAVRRWAEECANVLDRSNGARLRSDEQVHQELITRDQAVVKALMDVGFKGQAREEFAEALVAYAESYLRAWIGSGRILIRCKEKGMKLQGEMSLPLCGSDIDVLTIETLGHALIRFEAVLQEGRWRPERGATLTTFFIRQLLFCFANVYRTWSRDRQLLRSWISLEDLRENDMR